MRKEQNNQIDIKQADLKEAIVAYVLAKTPNRVQRTHIYNNFNKISQDNIDNAIVELIGDKRLLSGPDANARLEKFAHLNILREEDKICLYNYTGKEPICLTNKIGQFQIPRLLDGTRVSAEDVNQMVEAIAIYQNDVKSEFEKETNRKVGEIYRQMIGIFGVFVSIFAVIVISTDKMIRFNPDILSLDWWQLLGKSSALFLPIGIIIGLLLWIVLRVPKK